MEEQIQDLFAGLDGKTKQQIQAEVRRRRRKCLAKRIGRAAGVFLAAAVLIGVWAAVRPAADTAPPPKTEQQLREEMEVAVGILDAQMNWEQTLDGLVPENFSVVEKNGKSWQHFSVIYESGEGSRICFLTASRYGITNIDTYPAKEIREFEISGNYTVAAIMEEGVNLLCDHKAAGLHLAILADGIDYEQVLSMAQHMVDAIDCCLLAKNPESSQ